MCFSACVSSSDDFKSDILSGISAGDTIETCERFINNEAYKDRGLSFFKEKSLYVDVDRISRYDFDGAHKMKMSRIQAVLDECSAGSTRISRRKI